MPKPDIRRQMVYNQSSYLALNCVHSWKNGPNFGLKLAEWSLSLKAACIFHCSNWPNEENRLSLWSMWHRIGVLNELKQFLDGHQRVYTFVMISEAVRGAGGPRFHACLLCMLDRGVVMDSFLPMLFMWEPHVMTGERKTFLWTNENKIVNHKANSREVWGQKY